MALENGIGDGGAWLHPLSNAPLVHTSAVTTTAIEKKVLRRRMKCPVLLISIPTRYDKAPSNLKRKPPWVIEINKVKSQKNQSNQRSPNHKSYESADGTRLIKVYHQHIEINKKLKHWQCSSSIYASTSSPVLEFNFIIELAISISTAIAKTPNTAALKILFPQPCCPDQALNCDAGTAQSAR